MAPDLPKNFTGDGNDVIDGGAGFDRCVAGTGAKRLVRCEQ